MSDKDFIAFLNASGAQKGAPVFNMNTANTTRQARDILRNEYPMLAKQHINGAIIRAYKNNANFRNKLDEVMARLNITIVAPVEA